MPYFINILALFFTAQAQASCLKENIIENKFLVVTTKNLSTNFFAKTTSSPSSIKRISSSQKTSILSKTGSQKTLSTYLVEASSLSYVKSLFPEASVQPDCEIKFLSTTPGPDPLFDLQSWYFNSLNQSASVTLTPLRDVVIAVSDTGVDVDHVDLQDNLWRNQAELNGTANVDDDNNGYVDDIYGYDFGDSDSNPKPTVNDLSNYDHGTHVAGLIAATSFNSKGVSGIALNSVKIMSLKGFKSDGPSTISDLLETIYYAVDNGANVINASWGTEKVPEAAEIEAVNYAVQNNVVVVAAAGNDRMPASWFTPAGIENVITVASVNSSNQLSTFSNYGASIDFISPGGDGPERSSETLWSLGLGSNYLRLQGTSMAAPLIAGLIGALMSQSSSITAFQAVHILEESGTNYNLQPYLQSNNLETYTKPNFLNALEYLKQNQNLPDVKPVLDVINNSSRELASSSSQVGGGCSNSLASQSSQTESLESHIPYMSIFLILIPVLTLLGIKKRL